MLSELPDHLRKDPEDKRALGRGLIRDDRRYPGRVTSAFGEYESGQEEAWRDDA